MKDIPNFDQFVKVEEINKGWSNDKKYYVEIRNQERLLLRISDVSEFDEKKNEFEIMKKLAMVGINMSKPISYGNRVTEYIKNYKNCGQKLFGEEVYLSFLESHLECLANRPMSLLHADFQSDNMVISPDNELYAIDFQGSGVVDPYYALGGVMISAG